MSLRKLMVAPVGSAGPVTDQIDGKLIPAMEIDDQTGVIYVGGNPLTGGGGSSNVSRALVAVIDGDGTVPNTGNHALFSIPFQCFISSWTLLADQSGNVTVDVLSCSFASYPGGLASITGGNLPSLAGAAKNSASSPLGWSSVQLQAGDALVVQLQAADTPTLLSLTLVLTPGVAS